MHSYFLAFHVKLASILHSALCAPIYLCYNCCSLLLLLLYLYVCDYCLIVAAAFIDSTAFMLLLEEDMHVQSCSSVQIIS